MALAIKQPVFICQNCGDCCGIIPVVWAEWQLIRNRIKRMSLSERQRLAGQNREPLTCPLRDIENKKCAVYDARPTICKMQGEYEGLPCSHVPPATIRGREEGYRALNASQGNKSLFVGIMGVSLGWKELLKGVKP